MDIIRGKFGILIIESATYGSIIRDLERKIRLTVLINENMSMSEIQSDFLNVPARTVYRAVNKLVESGKLEHKRIHGKGKRERYSLTEDKVKSDITIRAFPEEVYNKGLSADEILAMQIRPKITQRNLALLINDERKFYRKELKNMKQFGETTNYYNYHISMISNCLGWITKLSMVINSGMFFHYPDKLDFARKNRDEYEDFLSFICDNIKQYNEKLGEKIIRQISIELDDLWILEKFRIG